jgi:aryl-alcohol dehydrogenase-like predicted oxidoreductase
VYSSGVSEEIIGKAIKKYNIPRHKVNVLTKCFSIVSEHENTFLPKDVQKSKDYVNQSG